MKRILLVLLAVIIVVAAGGAFVLSRLDSEALRAHLAEITTKATGKPLYLAQAPQLSLMPLGVTFGAAQWGMQDGKPAEQGLSASVKSGSVRLELLPLLSGRLVVDEVRLDSPAVTMRPEKAAAQAPAKAGEAAGGKGAAPGEIPLELARLSISNGSLLLEAEPGRTVRVEGFNASITDLKPGAEAAVKLDMGIACDNPDVAGNLALAAHVRQSGGSIALRQSKLTFTPLRGPLPPAVGPVQISLDATYALPEDRLDIAGFKLALQGLALEAAGKARPRAGEFQGTVRSAAEPRLLGGLLGVAVPVVPGSGKTVLESAVALTGDSLKLDGIKGMLDTTTLAGTLALGLGTTPAVRGALQLGDVVLDAAGGSAASPAGQSSRPEGQARAARPAESGVASASAPATVYPLVDLDIRVASLTASKITLKQVRAHVRGDGGRATQYKVDPLNWEFATGGSMQGSAGIALPAMRYSAAGRLRDVAVGPLLQAMQGKRPMDGVAAADYTLNCAGGNAAAIKASLAGNGSMTVQQIRLNDVSVLPKNTPVQGGVPSHFERLYVPFTIQSGIVSINGMTLTGQGLNATGKGVVRLPQENMDMTATVNVLGMQIPVQASGPFSDVSYRVDPKWAAKVLMQAPGALLEGGRDAGSKAGGAAKGLGGTVRGIFGR